MPQFPPQLTAKRSVLLFRVDNHVFDNDAEEMKDKIIQNNDWVGSINNVNKFPKCKTLKIAFNETTKATKAQETGLKLFSMKILKHGITQDTFHSILTCMRCYKMEDHSTNQCERDRDYKICSQ